MMLAGAACGLSVDGPRTYTLQEEITGDGFFDKFEWNTFADPTHGRVDFVNQTTAVNENLTYGVYLVFRSTSPSYRRS